MGCAVTIREEFKREVERRKQIESLPQNVGWVRKYERNTHLNNHIERERAEGHKIQRRPRLDEMDGDMDPMEQK